MLLGGDYTVHNNSAIHAASAASRSRPACHHALAASASAAESAAFASRCVAASVARSRAAADAAQRSSSARSAQRSAAVRRWSADDSSSLARMRKRDASGEGDREGERIGERDGLYTVSNVWADDGGETHTFDGRWRVYSAVCGNPEVSLGE